MYGHLERSLPFLNDIVWILSHLLPLFLPAPFLLREKLSSVHDEMSTKKRDPDLRWWMGTSSLSRCYIRKIWTLSYIAKCHMINFNSRTHLSSLDTCKKANTHYQFPVIFSTRLFLSSLIYSPSAPLLGTQLYGSALRRLKKAGKKSNQAF